MSDHVQQEREKKTENKNRKQKTEKKKQKTKNKKFWRDMVTRIFKGANIKKKYLEVKQKENE